MYRTRATLWAADIRHANGSSRADTVFTVTRRQAFGILASRHGRTAKISMRPIDEVPDYDRHHYVANETIRPGQYIGHLILDY